MAVGLTSRVGTPYDIPVMTSTPPYLLLGLFFLIAVGFAVAPILVAKLVAPRKPSPTKQAPYECGLPSEGDPWVQFRVQYYCYALLFVIFDVEVAFIYPWATVWQGLGVVGFLEMVLFVLILAAGLVYAWKRGLLEWR